MTSPEFETDYTDLMEQIYINDKYSIIYTFYDHHMCGPFMRYIYLHDNKSNHDITLIRDCPVGDGTPVLFNTEFIPLLDLALNNDKNTINKKQIITLLFNLLGHIDIKTCEYIKQKYNIDINKIINPIWNNKYFNIYYEAYTYSNILKYQNKNLCLAKNCIYFKSNMSYTPDIPKKIIDKVILIDNFACIETKKYGKILVDKSLLDQYSIRMAFHNIWDKKDRILFHKFISTCCV
uniref:Uncharacterized protein n=1 Tax=Mimivirus LCMiAC01 TaxID=2506608 RepID=A0A481Z043_9VIRU|nr:MAG: hypothetical protein LCMiAC01_01980 [Mimivirus LCMiAC01]